MRRVSTEKIAEVYEKCHKLVAYRVSAMIRVYRLPTYLKDDLLQDVWEFLIRYTIPKIGDHALSTYVCNGVAYFFGLRHQKLRERYGLNTQPLQLPDMEDDNNRFDVVDPRSSWGIDTVESDMILSKIGPTAATALSMRMEGYDSEEINTLLPHIGKRNRHQINARVTNYLTKARKKIRRLLCSGT